MKKPKPPDTKGERRQARPRVHKRHPVKKRPNPFNPLTLPGIAPRSPLNLFEDPIIMKHALGFIVRWLELHPPNEAMPTPMQDSSTDNKETPDDNTPEKAED